RGLAAGPEMHFGFQTVKKKERREKIKKVFENVAKKYDVMNDSMTLGIHRVWKDILQKKMNPCPGTLLLDVAKKTGDIAFQKNNYVRSVQQRQLQRKLKHHQNLSWQEIFEKKKKDKFNSLGDSQVEKNDISREMLKVGKQKKKHLGYSEEKSWVLGNAEELPFDKKKFDVYTIAFGIRNEKNIDLALQEAYRVLKPGEKNLCLEFSHVSNPLLKKLYDLYRKKVIPVLGEVIAGDWKKNQYLVESIRQFPPQEELKAMIKKAGFFKVDYENLNFKKIAIHSGFKL
ncbi:COQ5 protein, partial [Erythrocercus mccallii]|nr:COQ5 protein [Erythrocercus mccallii]